MDHVILFRDIVSGKRRGAAAALARAVLRAAEVPYSAAVRWRNARYEWRRSPVFHTTVPVISVGNLTLGGTGKTPMVKWIARRLRDHGVRVAIISRGYGAEVGAKNDEALELEQSLPDVPHLQNPDRVAGAQAAVQELQTQVVLLDDAFQHRRLARDLDIVLLDATEPFGYGHVFPRGTLREPIESLGRAHLVCLTRANLVDQRTRDSIRQRVASIAANVSWCEVSHVPDRLLSSTGDYRPVHALANQPIAGFCGIGNPAGFQRTLVGAGCDLRAWREFPDHHRYSADDVGALEQWVRDSGARAAVCTHKDLVKLQIARVGDVPLWALTIEMQFLNSAELMEEKLARVIGGAARNDEIRGCQSATRP